MENKALVSGAARVFFILALVFGCNLSLRGLVFAEEGKKAEQEVNDFSLTQYNDGGGKKWELNGKSAEVEDSVVSMDEVSVIAFGENRAVKLKAEEGNFDTQDRKVQLETNVVAKTTDGARVTTDSLCWDPENKNVFTEERISIKKSDFEINGRGAVCDLTNKTAELKKDVTARLDFSDAASSRNPVFSSSGTIITCDGPLEINYRKNKAVFHNNVRVDDREGKIEADRMDIYFKKNTMRLKCIIARGDVRVKNKDSVTYSERAIYLADEGRIIFPKRPRLIVNRDYHE